ncbi:MAG: hypothetical protein Q8P68_00030 [Candidatus Peregrinibacteria bacterium]|nr:hypothetical protein [Candidatus Peregrinibacteria bacterium]MDZ4244901.1 hypothetical protein [Candidatus Gracilibacteria bacterium]
MSKKILQLVLIIMASLLILGCAEEGPKFTILNSKLGLLNEDNTLTEGYKFSPTDHDFALNAEIQNNTKEEAQIETVWQYRQRGSFREIIRTDRNAAPGVSDIAFPFQSSKDMFRGEYLVEIYLGEKLLGAHRFWILTEGKAADPNIDIYELTKCSVKQDDIQCMSEEICEAIYEEIEGSEDVLPVCEARGVVLN